MNRIIHKRSTGKKIIQSSTLLLYTKRKIAVDYNNQEKNIMYQLKPKTNLTLIIPDSNNILR